MAENYDSLVLQNCKLQKVILGLHEDAQELQEDARMQKQEAEKQKQEAEKQKEEVKKQKEEVKKLKEQAKSNNFSKDIVFSKIFTSNSNRLNLSKKMK